MNEVCAFQVMAKNWTVGGRVLKHGSSAHSSSVGDLLKAHSAWVGCQ